MMINRIQFDKISTQWEILKMRAAYIDAERLIIEESETGMADGLFVGEMTAKDIAAMSNMTIKEAQIHKLERELGIMAQKHKILLENEQYELLAELQDWYDRTLKQLNKLRKS